MYQSALRERRDGGGRKEGKGEKIAGLQCIREGRKTLYCYTDQERLIKYIWGENVTQTDTERESQKIQLAEMWH